MKFVQPGYTRIFYGFIAEAIGFTATAGVENKWGTIG
jgi:hypothetical protein